MGALVPTVLFNYVGNTTKFWIVCWAGLLGFFITVMFVPDATGECSGVHMLLAQRPGDCIWQ